ncbi:MULTISPECIES: hypothetical protein [unclassified Mycolicibacterium]|uniref:bS18 family ribosomal protein n=1 Tax=unclassified Mycolicibacterium TaxID=2636767 RepID=UPI001F4BE06D|nr:hypothetical protein [Mycolicibacterium sp. YH-1]UNB56368.1 hypothetical protein L0M16_32230 [Mycolicibacterium sp. YH-1]
MPVGFATASRSPAQHAGGLGLREVGYRDTTTLRLFISERGRTWARRVTGLTVKGQRQVLGIVLPMATSLSV